LLIRRSRAVDEVKNSREFHGKKRRLKLT
jgi:hypothetical protein